MHTKIYLTTMCHLVLSYIIQNFHRRLFSGSQKMVSCLSGCAEGWLLKDKKKQLFYSHDPKGTHLQSVPKCPYTCDT